MTVALGDLLSTSPMPVGRAFSVAVPNASQSVAWPTADNWFYAGPGATNPMNIGPISLPYRYWLIVAANLIAYVTSGWVRYDQKLRLVDGAGQPKADLNGIVFFQKADSSEPHGGSWVGASIEARFFCEANLTYSVQLLGSGGGANTVYHQHSYHMSMHGYTVGEGVY